MNALDILFIGKLPPFTGGSAVACSQLLRELDRNGHTIRAIAPTSPEMQADVARFDSAHPRISVVRYWMPEMYNDLSVPRPESVWDDEQSQLERLIDRLVAERRPDVILTGHEIFSPPVSACARRYGIVWAVRAGGFSLQVLESGVVPAEVVRRLKPAFAQADAWMVEAEHVALLARRNGCSNVRVIANAVDLQRFTPGPRPMELCRCLDIDPDAPVVLHASNFKPVKRVQDIADSAATVLAKYPNAVYVMVGDGQCRGTMEQRCRKLGIADKFRFTGHVEYQRMPGILQLATVVVMASEFEQQSCLYLEAQATARVLIASDVDGSRAVVEHGVTGLLYPMGNPEALAAETVQALGNPALRASIGQQALRRVGVHSLETVCAQVAEVLVSVAGQRVR